MVTEDMKIKEDGINWWNFKTHIMKKMNIKE